MPGQNETGLLKTIFGHTTAALNLPRKFTEAGLENFQDQHNLIENLLRHDNKFLKQIKFDVTEANPLSAYRDAASSPSSLSSLSDIEAADDSKEAKAVAALNKAYKAAFQADDKTPADDPRAKLKDQDAELRKAAAKLASDITKAENETRSKKGSPNPKTMTARLQKMRVQLSERVNREATSRAGLQTQCVNEFFDPEIAAAKAKEAAPTDPLLKHGANTQLLIDAGKIKTGDGEKPVSEQLQTIKGAELKSIDTTRTESIKKATQKAENITQAYYDQIRQQALIANMLKYQTPSAVKKAHSADSEAAAVIGSVPEKSQLTFDFLKKVAAEQKGKIKGPLGTEITCKEDGTFSVNLRGLTKAQRQAGIDLNSKLLHAQFGNGVTFTATSEAEDPKEAEREVADIIREQVKAEANNGYDLSKQAFQGIWEGKPTTFVYSDKPLKAGQTNLSVLYKGRESELTRLAGQSMARNIAPGTTPEANRSREMKGRHQDNLKKIAPKATPSQDNPAPTDGLSTGRGRK